MPVRAPRRFGELPYAHRLEPYEGEVDRDGSYDSAHFDGAEWEDVDGGGSGFTECAFTAAALTRGRYRRTRFDDVWLEGVRIVGADLAESSWLDCEFTSGLLAGLQLHGSQLRRVVFHNCKFDSVNLRAAALRDVAFANCLLRDVDFGGATLTGVSFPGSTLDGVSLEKATLAKVDLREAAGLRLTAGLDALRGATISSLQLLELAPGLAGVLGITVDDR
ncbi:pentapeptide repeat-containing protein [Yinghuangia sp. YIM S09857]|uniref:pentapeptide repeat-containing protein n=1 Tax=Yinghuangia sp. YIM S09857 TaxID=3436929 RepID=UPI003F53D01C